MKSKLPAVFAESQTADKQINADEMTVFTNAQSEKKIFVINKELLTSP